MSRWQAAKLSVTSPLLPEAASLISGTRGFSFSPSRWRRRLRLIGKQVGNETRCAPRSKRHQRRLLFGLLCKAFGSAVCATGLRQNREIRMNGTSAGITGVYSYASCCMKSAAFCLTGYRNVEKSGCTGSTSYLKCYKGRSEPRL